MAVDCRTFQTAPSQTLICRDCTSVPGGNGFVWEGLSAIRCPRSLLCLNNVRVFLTCSGLSSLTVLRCAGPLPPVPKAGGAEDGLNSMLLLSDSDGRETPTQPTHLTDTSANSEVGKPDDLINHSASSAPPSPRVQPPPSDADAESTP